MALPARPVLRSGITCFAWATSRFQTRTLAHATVRDMHGGMEKGYLSLCVVGPRNARSRCPCGTDCAPSKRLPSTAMRLPRRCAYAPASSKGSDALVRPDGRWEMGDELRTRLRLIPRHRRAVFLDSPISHLVSPPVVAPSE